MNKAKLGLTVVLVIVAAVAAGFLWGAWGRWGVERELRDTQARLLLAQAQAGLRGARVDLGELNYGKAAGAIDGARKVMESLAARLEQSGRREAAAAVREAMARAGDAQQLAASVDQAAAGRVADALKALERAEGAQK
jgi:hypothetical protein